MEVMYHEKIILSSRRIKKRTYQTLYVETDFLSGRKESVYYR